ncbi:FixH family protein [Bacillus dakarensis]|uniref:FixH family protein n=1 Tax=Robertmurraya dakarensis TaxID=1926278 RepID=UPI000980EC32|nr:FixH family protein [Bacillus dakarensis]
MKKMLAGFFVCFGMLLLTACAGEESIDEPQFLEVDLTISPENAQPNETVTFEAKVTYGSEEVTDADEVAFEIWRAHDEDHEKFEIEHAENGIYRLEKTFEREGTYYIISHVTGRSMHNMPKKEFVVGEPSEPEGDSSSQNNMDMEDETMDH